MSEQKALHTGLSEDMPGNKRNGIAVIFPGLGYHADKPLLYFAGKLAAEYGCTVRRISYRNLPCGLMGDSEKQRAAVELAVKQCSEQLADVEWSDYEDILFISKSIGTVIGSVYAQRKGLQARSVLYTPLEITFQYAGGDAVVFHGRNDPWAPDTAAIEAGCRKAGFPLHTYDGANHSLETGHVLKDLEYLQEVMRITAEFIAVRA